MGPALSSHSLSAVFVCVIALREPEFAVPMLRALREARALSLADIAAKTFVRRAYLQALEELNIDQLPSRPFAVGYVKAYAEALGASGELAVRQFKIDSPSPDEALKAPVGVRKERDPRLSWIAGSLAPAGALVVDAGAAGRAVGYRGYACGQAGPPGR